MFVFPVLISIVISGNLIPRHPSLILILHVGHRIHDGVVIPGATAVIDFRLHRLVVFIAVVKRVLRLGLRLDRGDLHAEDGEVLLKRHIGPDGQAGARCRAGAGTLALAVARLALVDIASRVLQVLEIRRRLQDRQHLRLRPGNFLPLVPHQRTVVITVHRRQREIQASSTLLAVPVIGAFIVHHLLLAVPIGRKIRLIRIAIGFLIQVSNVIPIPVRIVVLHTKGIHDLFLTILVAIKVTRHNIDHKDLLFVGLFAVVLLIFTVGRNSSQVLQTVVTVYRIETTAQKHLFRVPHTLRRRTSQGHRGN